MKENVSKNTRPATLPLEQLDERQAVKWKPGVTLMYHISVGRPVLTRIIGRPFGVTMNHRTVSTNPAALPFEMRPELTWR